MPNLAIVGYGKMGRLIDQLAPEFGFNVMARVDMSRSKARMWRSSFPCRPRW